MTDTLPEILHPTFGNLIQRKLRGEAKWFHLAAIERIRLGFYHAIPTRNRDELYLLRVWLNRPNILPEADQIDGNPFDSGNSTLLHFFARGDDDESLHDHPWDFRTEILSGGYQEHLPPDDWTPTRCIDGRIVSSPGPSWDTNIAIRSQGSLIYHNAEDLHCVGRVLPGHTWTLVTTRHKRRSWGFHPPGRAWIPWRTYLNERQVA